MSRRGSLRLLSIGMSLIVLLTSIGCGTKEGREDRAIVKLMGWGDMTTVAKYQILEQAFEGENPEANLVVEILDMDTYNQKLPIMIASRTAPDIFECVPELAGSFPTYASMDAFVDLEPFTQRDEVDLDQWFPAVIQSCRYRGTLYVLPKKISSPSCMHYNMDLFDAEGLSYPSRDWTWSDAVGLARRLTKDVDGDGRMDQWGLAWPFAEGYEGPMMKGWSWTRGDDREVNIDDPLFYETMQWMADLIHIEHVAPSLEQTESSGLPGYLLFTTGKVAMQSGGRWQTAIYKREIGDRFRWDTVWLPIPERDRKRRYLMGCEAWGIYRGSGVIEEAWKVVKWISGPRGSTVLGRIGGAVPAVKSVAYSSDFLDSTPPSREGNLMWLEAMDYAVRPPLGREWAKILLMMDQTFELGWNGQRSFKALALELKPKLDRLLQGK